MDFFDGQNDNEKIRTHMENAITNKYDAILLHPAGDPEAQVAPAHEALDAGLTVVAVGTLMNNESAFKWSNANPYEQGAVNARYAAKIVPKNAKAVVLWTSRKSSLARTSRIPGRNSSQFVLMSRSLIRRSETGTRKKA